MDKPRRSSREINRLIRGISDGAAFSQKQATAVGVSRQALARRVANGTVERLGPASFRVAAAPALDRVPRLDPGRQQAAIVVSRGLGLALWSASAWLGIEREVPRLVHVIVPPGPHISATDWYRPHRLAAVQAGDIIVQRGVQTTSAARTIRDFAAVLRSEVWAAYSDRWVEEALMQQLLDLSALEAQRERAKGRQVRGRLGRLIDYHSGRGTEDLKSEGERWLRNFLERAGLPLPQFNAKLPGTTLQVDALFPDVLALEFDSYKHHSTRPKLVRDARRRRETSRQGLLSWSVTADDLQHRRKQLEDDIVWALTHSAGSASAPASPNKRP